VINCRLLILCSVLPFLTYCQDTTFVKKHFFDSTVKNVFNGPDGIYAKTGEGLYKLKNDKWALQNTEFTKNYVFFNKEFYESDYIPNPFLFDIKPLQDLIPQRSLSNPTLARSDNRLFVSTGGNLYEYFINTAYKRTFGGYSVRNIYFDDVFSVTSTYKGIFFNDSIRAELPRYSSGYFQKIGDRYFLCSDQLFEMTEFGKFTLLNITDINVSGHFRKLLEWNNRNISQNTRSINIWDYQSGLTPIHRGEEYFDIEVADNKLLTCTGQGEVIEFTEDSFKILCNVKARVRDLYVYGDVLYISSDKGLFTLEKFEPKSLKRQNGLPNVVGVMMDLNKNLWISTENGLYVQPADKQFPISFIPNVEFNRAALTIYNDQVYAGSVEGLFIIDIFNVSKNILPQTVNTVAVGFKNWLLYSVILLMVLAGAVLWLLKYRQKKKNLVIANTSKKNEEKTITIEQMEQEIINQRIMTVENLAEFYGTNSVQLNRILKSFNTTPGKILRQTKLKHARELLKNNVPLHEISQKVGYSAVFLKSKLK
jgi:AraC-like DNA-binding protein